MEGKILKNYSKNIEEETLSESSILMQHLTSTFWKKINKFFSNDISKSKETHENISSYITKKNIELIINWEFSEQKNENNWEKQININIINSLITEKISNYKKNNSEMVSKEDFKKIYQYWISLFSEIKNNSLGLFIENDILENHFLNDKVFADIISWTKLN